MQVMWLVKWLTNCSGSHLRSMYKNFSRGQRDQPLLKLVCPGLNYQLPLSQQPHGQLKSCLLNILKILTTPLYVFSSTVCSYVTQQGH